MSIPALGGGANDALQRLLRETAERALADEQALLDGEDPASASSAAARNAASPGRTGRRRGAGASPESPAQAPDEAIVVKLGDADQTERLEVAGGWITAKRGPLETKAAPEPKRFEGPDIKGEADALTAAEGRTATAPAASGADVPELSSEAKPPVSSAEEEASGLAVDGSAEDGAAQPEETAEVTAGQAPGRARNDQAATLDRLIVVLKRTGISFRDAYQVLREINAGGPLPPKAQLQARWSLADPDAWEARARTEQARSEGTQPAAAKGEPPAARTEQPAVRAEDADLRRTAVDDVIRDRAWHRDNPDPDRSASSGLSVRDDARPTLQSVVRYDTTNQAYIAALNTAEFQRLVTILGAAAPGWFWELRGHRGLRGLAERPAIAKLNTTRIAGTRLGAWILAILGMALLWYLGVTTGTWW